MESHIRTRTLPLNSWGRQEKQAFTDKVIDETDKKRIAVWSENK